MRRTIPLLLLSLASCVTPPGRPSPAGVGPAQSLTATSTASRVVLLSFDGLGADQLAAQQGLTAFTALRSEGTTARVIPVSPTATSTTHVSILTGADPQRHGIVSNRYHRAGTPLDQVTSGKTDDIDAESIVEAARRQGKRVGAVPFLSVDGRNETRRADFGLVWTSSLTRGKTIRLTRADFRREWLPPTWSGPAQSASSFSPVMRARIEWSAPKKVRRDVDITAFDTTDDQIENYDRYVIETEDGEVRPDASGWFAITRPTDEGLFGSWSKVLSTAPDLTVELYWGAISRTEAYPDSFRRMLDADAGFWPGNPDEQSDIDPATFEQQIVRLSEFLSRAQVLTLEKMDFDLLLAYQPPIDQAAHNFLDYDADVIHRSFETADRALAAVRSRLDLTRDALVVVGDHGVAAIEREVRVNRLLAELGFAARWRAVTYGGVAHLYRNGEPDDGEALRAALEKSGYFERIDVRQANWHRNSGQLIAWAPPGTDLSDSSEAPVVGERRSYGHHGALASHRELQTVLLAAGRGVPGGPIGDVAQTRIARFVCTLLGITPPLAAE
jgi:hypothetical protein